MSYDPLKSQFSDDVSHDDVSVMRELLHLVKGLSPVSMAPALEFSSDEIESGFENDDFEQ